MPRFPAALLAMSAAIPALALAAGLAGGPLRLEPAGPASAVQAEAAGLRLTGLVGQPVAARSGAEGRILNSGFVTPTGVTPGEALFADGFEEELP